MASKEHHKTIKKQFIVIAMVPNLNQVQLGCTHCGFSIGVYYAKRGTIDTCGEENVRRYDQRIIQNIQK